jgi:glycosyltransferase involved in cell wall biosynthesis
MTCNIIDHGITGLLVCNTADWVAHIEELLMNPALGRQLAARGLEHIRHQYSLNTHAPRLVEVFRKVACI